MNPETMTPKEKQNPPEMFQEIFQKIEKEPELKFVGELFQSFPQSEVFLVGGINRDLIIGRESEDYDLVIREVTIDKLIKFLKQLGEVNLVGRNFGVLKFKPKGIKLEHKIEISLPRTEHASVESMGGRRDFEVQANPELPIKTDLSRRDFTVNAMAWDLKNHELIDPYNGLRDIKKGEIRAVGDPKQRFKEDYSRMLRALRFACELNFKIENKTWRAIKELMPNINKKRKNPEGKLERVIPYEVISKELVKSLIANPQKTLELWDKSGALKELIPELLKMKDCPQPEKYHSEGDVWTHTKLALKKLKSKEFEKEFDKDALTPELVLGVLFHDIAKPLTIKTPEKNGTKRIRFDEHTNLGAELTGKICRRLKISSVPDFDIKAKRIQWLVKNHLLGLLNKENPF